MAVSAPSVEPPVRPERTARGTLESFTIRRRTTGEAAAARALFMRRLRIALPAAALVLVAAFVFNARPGAGDDAFLDDFADVEATPRNLETANPEFSGVDSGGNPYEITAVSAVRRPERETLVELEAPRAVTMGADNQSVVEAAAGIFDTDDKKLLLKDGVTFEHAIGKDNYVLNTNAATVSIDDQTVVSDEGVDGAGPGGSSLSADRMRADNRRGVVTFEGNVRMRLYPAEVQDKTGSAKPGENG